MDGLAAPLPWSHERPDPPADMPADQAAVWRDVVSAMRPRWFSKESHALLARYCCAQVECARIERELATLPVGSPDYDRLSSRRNATAASALSYARALRITPHSNKREKVDARDAARSIHPKPWELDDDRPRRKPWEIEADDPGDLE
jgi:hypothetical protein